MVLMYARNNVSTCNGRSSIVTRTHLTANRRWNSDAQTCAALAQRVYHILDHNDANPTRVAGAKYTIHVVMHPRLRCEVELRHRDFEHITMM